jgi:hypothetical protein
LIVGSALRDESRLASDLSRRGDRNIENRTQASTAFFQSPGEWMKTISVVYLARSTNCVRQSKIVSLRNFFWTKRVHCARPARLKCDRWWPQAARALRFLMEGACTRVARTWPIHAMNHPTGCPRPEIGRLTCGQISSPALRVRALSPSNATSQRPQLTSKTALHEPRASWRHLTVIPRS